MPQPPSPLLQQAANPLLHAKLPGKVYQLPSKGYFYQPGVIAPHVQNAEIHVQPMSAMVEIKLRSADLLFSNKVLREICVECAPEILRPELLCAKDVDALFMFLLVTTYGTMKQIKSIHDCPGAKLHDHMVDLGPIITNPNNAVLEHRETTYRVELSTGQTVQLKPVAFNDMINVINLRAEIAKRDEKDSIAFKANDLEQLVLTDLIAVIGAVDTAVNGKPLRVTDRNQISEWLRTLSRPDIDKIIGASGRSNEWGFDFHVDVTCPDCGAPYRHELELNPVSFFTG